ncbi:hypothetical protein F511_12352 [Dorcoceras hygrometricum]|uniref:Ycf20-like protein n=1 Tax=Dorcoceras hygrometricum TaxID=472368 RepID=A0A2Z7BGU0_9LAMI|nr:hypothetical protein F511_12352 [Dorcoceras hygrometricum]
MPSSVNLTGFRLTSAIDSNSELLASLSFGKLTPTPFLAFFDANGQSFTANKFKRMTWSLRSAADGSRLNSSSSTNDSPGGTRLIRVIQTVRVTFINRLKELRRNLPVKLFSFLVGFYSATAFATVIGQTGDWDVLSAAFAVALVEGIGALMYKYSLNFVDNIKSLIIIFNYWKAGLSLGLFLDSFKF